MKTRIITASGSGVFIAIFALVVLIVLPSYSPFFDISYNSQRVFIIIILALTGIFTILGKDVFSVFFVFSERTQASIAILFVLGIIAATASNHIFMSFLEVGLFALLITAIVFTAQFVKHYEDRFMTAVLAAIAIMVTVYVANVAYGYIQGFFILGFPTWPSTNFLQLYSNGKPIYTEPFLGFVHVRFLNHLHTWSLPLFALMVVSIPKRKWAVKYSVFVLSALWWMLVFAADARGTMLSSTLSFVFVVLLFRKQIIEWIKVFAGGAAAGLIFYFFFFKFLQTGGKTIMSRYGDSGRLQMWENALNLILQNPFFGVGPMHYADYTHGFPFAAPHNIYLQFASEWGLIAFGILVFICISSYIAWIKFCRGEIKKGDDSIQLSVMAALTASITAAAIHGFFSGIINTPMSQVLMVIVLGWAIGFYQTKKTVINGAGQEFKWRTVIAKTTILIAVIYTGSITWYSYQRLDESRQIYLDQSDRTILYPRFWDHGIIGVSKD